MSLMMYSKVLILLGVLHPFQLQPIIENTECSFEEAFEIVNNFTNLLNETVDNWSFKVDELLVGAKTIITSSKESTDLQKVIEDYKQNLNSLGKQLCATEDFQLKLSGLSALELKCTASGTKKETSIKSKVLKKFESNKVKSRSSLQKCRLKGSGGCSTVDACCQQVLQQSDTKINDSINEIDEYISVAALAYNNCLKKIAKEVVKIEAAIKEQLIECRNQEDSKSQESNEENFQTTTDIPNEISNSDTDNNWEQPTTLVSQPSDPNKSAEISTDPYEVPSNVDVALESSTENANVEDKLIAEIQLHEEAYVISVITCTDENAQLDNSEPSN